MVAEVPFVDCLNTMCDDTLPLTVIEWEEWGNPGADVEVYAVMKGYTPYEGVRPVRYPDMLVTAGLEDPLAGYWETAKWVQAIAGRGPRVPGVPLKTELDAGHAGPPGRYAGLAATRRSSCRSSPTLRALGRPPRVGDQGPGPERQGWDHGHPGDAGCAQLDDHGARHRERMGSTGSDGAGPHHLSRGGVRRQSAGETPTMPTV